MFKNLVSFCIIAFIAAFFALIGQSTTSAQTSRIGATIEGTVTDNTGAVVPQAIIVIRNIPTGQSRTLRADDRGFFRAEQLPVSTYEVSVNHSGFASYRQSSFDLTLGQVVHLSIVLALASASQQVTVNAQPSAIDTTQTSVVSSVDQERIEELPVRSRNYLDFVLLAPGVSNAPSSSLPSGSTLPSSGFTFGGLRSQSNNVSIDGLDNNDEYTGSSRTELSPEIVQEFQVVNNGLSAESGGASGGSINVITRSGANVIHGDAFIFAQDSAVNARDPFETEPEKPSFRRFRAGFALGGPIVKDRTFYYVAGEQEHNRGQIGSDIDPAVAAAINPFLASGAFPGLPTRQITTAFSPIARAETEAAGKLDHQLTKNTALMLRYAFTNNKEAGDAFNTGGLMDASSRGSSFTSDNSLSGSLTTVLASQAVSDLRFQAATRRAVLRTNQPFGSEIDIAGLATFGRPYAGNNDRRENHYQLVYSYARTKNKHLWKVGATINRVRLRADVPDGFGGAYLFGSVADFLAANPDQFRQSFGSSHLDFPVTSLGGFAQDHWSLSHQLTLDIGMRYDFEHLPSGFNEDTNNFSPRIGLAWSPSAKWVFRGGYGVFFDRFVLANLTRAIEKNGVQAFEQVADGSTAAGLFTSAQGGPLLAPAIGIAPSIFSPDPAMATPYSQQASAGAEYLLAKNLTVRADYLFVHGVKLPRTLNANLLPPIILAPANAAGLGVPNPTAQQLGREVFSPARLNPQFDGVYQLQDSADSTYNGVSFTLSRTMNEELEFSASYTLSKTYDNASNYDEQPQNPFDLSAERALSLQDQQQRFVFNALWDLPIGPDEDSPQQSTKNSGWLTKTFSHIEVAPIFTAESGRPVNPLTGLDSNESHAFPLSGRPLAFGRDSLMTPATVTMDLRVLKYFPFGEYKHLDVVAESFNLLNHANVAQINPVFGSALMPMAGFREPIEGTGARQIQFSLDFEF
ncbi:MAG TPA: TonB-dependent receptor [Candidatus Acidoferrales bacterium]|nr:TonB-dependent receptor [Candidatus Acidoferrales bacterium]